MKNVEVFFTSALEKQKCFLWCHVVNVSKQRFSLFWHADNITLKKKPTGRSSEKIRFKWDLQLEIS